MLTTKALFDQVFVNFLQQDNTQELFFRQPIVAHVVTCPQDANLVKQSMSYVRFVYMNLQGKIWILCIGQHQFLNTVDNNGVYQADLAMFRILGDLEPADVWVPIKARLRSSRTFYYSVVCGNHDNELCFFPESKYYELLQVFSHDKKLNNFWMPPRYQHVDIQDGRFNEARSGHGFFQTEAVPYIVNLVNSVISASDTKAS